MTTGELRGDRQSNNAKTFEDEDDDEDEYDI